MSGLFVALAPVFLAILAGIYISFGSIGLTTVLSADTVTTALRASGWSVTQSDIGYVAKESVDLPPEARKEVEEFLEALDDNDDVHRIYAALK